MGRDTGAALYAVAHDEAVRALSAQERIADDLRGRAGLLLSTAAIATSFLGAPALDASPSEPLIWAAIVAFVAVAVVSLAILWPRSWEFATDARKVIVNRIEAGMPIEIDELHRDLCLDMHAVYLRNRRTFEQLAALFQIASGILVTEVILWCVAIISTV